MAAGGRSLGPDIPQAGVAHQLLEALINTLL